MIILSVDTNVDQLELPYISAGDVKCYQQCETLREIVFIKLYVI